MLRFLKKCQLAKKLLGQTAEAKLTTVIVAGSDRLELAVQRYYLTKYETKFIDFSECGVVAYVLQSVYLLLFLRNNVCLELDPVVMKL